MGKRAQVTIFIILGMIILVGIAAFLYVDRQQKTSLLDENLLETGPIASSLKPQIRQIVESCLETVTTPGIYLSGIQGGLIYPNPQEVLLLENAVYNYGLVAGENTLDREAMEDDLAQYVEETLDLCLEPGFGQLELQGIQMRTRPKQATTNIGQEQVTINLRMGVRATQDGVTVGEDSFTATVPLKVGQVLDEADRIITAFETNPGQLPLSMERDDRFYVTTFPFDAQTIIYSISDDDSIIAGAPFTFMFAIEQEAPNAAPVLYHVPDFVLKVGSTLTHQLVAEDEEEHEMTFSSSNNVLPIDEEGLINVTVSAPGVFGITITVEDSQGGSDSQDIRLVVEE